MTLQEKYDALRSAAWKFKRAVAENSRSESILRARLLNERVRTIKCKWNKCAGKEYDEDIVSMLEYSARLSYDVHKAGVELEDLYYERGKKS